MLTLAWDPNKESDLAGYRLYEGTQPGIYALKYTLPKNQTQVDVTGLEPGPHYFSVTAFNTKSAESGFSNEISHLEPSATTTLQVNLNWGPVTTYSDGSPLPAGAASYDVFRGQQATMADRAKINPTPLTNPAFVDATVQSGSTYYYQVRTAGAPSSDYSAIATPVAKKPAPPQNLTAVIEVKP